MKNSSEMKHLFFFVILLAPLGLFAQLDNSFGSEGRVAVNFGTPVNGGPVLIQPADQKIVMAGLTTSGSARYWYVARFTADGSLDPSFGNGGVLYLAFNIGALETPYLAIQSTGNIILAGLTLTSTAQNPVLFRITPAGQVDYSFSSTGYVQLHNLIWVGALAVQSDDKIVVGSAIDDLSNGFAVARLTKDGAYDATFGTNGVWIGAGILCNSLAFENDGSIVAAGPVYPNHAEALHLSTKGVLDTHFGTSGYANLTVNQDEVSVTGVTVIEDNYIVLAGHYFPNVKNGNERFLVMELTPQGKFNTAFAGNGKLSVAFDGYDAYGAGAIETWGGRLVVAGSLTPAKGPGRIGLCRILADGTIDQAFGSNGIEVTDWWLSSYAVGATSIALERDAKIVVGANLASHGIGAVRYLNPIIIKPPVITNATSSPESTSLTAVTAALNIFPNPAGQTLYIRGIDPGQKTTLVITDGAGRTVLTERPGSFAEWSLDIHLLTAGAYFLTVSTPVKRVTLPFVKVR
jgi:uncharacterized delta-60 repeat protein